MYAYKYIQCLRNMPILHAFIHVASATTYSYTRTRTQTSIISGQGQVLTTSTNPGVKFRIGVGSSVIEMKLKIPIGTASGEVQCDGGEQRRDLSDAIAAPLLNASGDATWLRSSEGHHGYHQGVSLRQSALEAVILVIPATIDVLSDPFKGVNYAPGRVVKASGAAKSKPRPVGNATITPPPPALSTQRPLALLSDVINARTLTTVVIATVSLAVGNTVAASAASSSASMSNAFQMIGHAQCEPLCYVCVYARARVRM
jgi:hypothetical protein